jgi:hypothetical protein
MLNELRGDVFLVEIREIVMGRCKTNFFLMQCSGVMPFFDTNKFLDKRERKRREL